MSLSQNLWNVHISMRNFQYRIKIKHFIILIEFASVAYIVLSQKVHHYLSIISNNTLLII